MARSAVNMTIGVCINTFLQLFVSFVDIISSLVVGVLLGLDQMILSGGKIIQAFIEVP